MLKKISFGVALLLSVCSLASADWKILEGGDPRGMDAGNSTMKVEISVPQYHASKVEIDGKQCTVLHIPGSSMHMVQGCPVLPKMTKLVCVPHGMDVKMQVVGKEEVEVALDAPVVPSKGHFTREIPYESVPFEFGPVYRENAYWVSEKEQVQMGDTFLLRDNCGVRIQLIPIRVNHVEMKMKVVKKLVVSLSFSNNSARFSEIVRHNVRPGRTFEKLYQDSFLNPQTVASNERGTVPAENNRKLVVVTPSEFAGLLTDWVNWKKQSGYEVTVKSYAAGTSASTIKSDLQGLYDNTATRFGYVVLIGDAGYASNFETASPMPTFKGKFEGAAADRIYVRLAGADNYPDAFISRISGNADEIAGQLRKIVSYEKSPAAGTWYSKGVGIASAEGSPSDKERMEWIFNGGGSSQKVPVVDGGLRGFGFTTQGIYDPGASSSQVTNAVNPGVGVICYIGHGSSTSWASSGFNTNNARALSNGNAMPVVWSVACVNGDFVRTAQCFAEAWLRNANGGAVAMEAASTNEAWVPPCDKQAATLNAMIKRTHFNFGALEAVGCVKALEVWGDADRGQGNQLAEQCNLFGDCTTLVRTKSPATTTVTATRNLDNTLGFQVASEGRGVAQATVTIHTEDLAFTASADTDDAGNISISLENAPAGVKLFCTVVGSDLLPVVAQPIE